MILQVHFAFQGSFAPRMRAYDRLSVRMMAEVLPMEVLFQVAVAVWKDFKRASVGSPSQPTQKIH